MDSTVTYGETFTKLKPALQNQYINDS